ncbi:MAG: TIGR04086 family membrane protein [Bacilli bacterium]|nr:TIGR04086 family membrane protein [Bacilli bacterium]MBQ8902338.1 TIGR04086 family membrane protein [Bacilli bacterium]
MNKLINYLKFTSIFLIIELMLTFIISLLNLFGLNSGITSIIMLISNVVLFFILNYINAFKLKKKGFLEGILLGLIFIILMILIKVILFNSSFRLSTFIYYLILFVTSVLGGMFGVNKKSDK